MTQGDFLGHGGEAAALIRAFDWASTPLGPMAAWPQSLKTATALILNASVAMVLLWGKEGRMIFNDAYSEFSGGRHPQDLGIRVREGWPELAEFHDQVMTTGLAGQTLKFRDWKLMLDRDGRLEPAWLNLDYSPVPDESGKPAGVLAIVVETTERVAARTALKAVSEKATAEAAEREAVLRQLAEGVIVTDAEGRITFVNEAAERLHGVKMLGVSPDEYSDKYHLLTEDGAPHPPLELPLARAILKGERVTEARWRIRRPDGVEIVAVGSASPVIAPDGRRIGGALTIRDDSERARTEARYRLAAQATNDVIWDANLVTDEVTWSEDLLSRFGHDPSAMGEARDWWLEHVHEEDRERIDSSLRAVIEGGETRWSAEYRFIAADGRAVPVLDRGFVLRDAGGRALRMIGAMLDLSERKRAEAELRALNETLEARVAEATSEREQAEEALRQAQKMEAVGQLTGGVAHDFNNLLTVITGNVDLACRLLGPETPERARRALENAKKGADNAAQLTQRLLVFSRRQPLAPATLDANRLIADMAELVDRALGETIRLEIVPGADLWTIHADPHQLENAILNLAVNARDAMPEGGQLRIEAGNCSIAEGSDDAKEAAPGDYVRIAVSDSGEGMDKQVRQRAFDPFFTTKQVGKGTGLGLSMVYGFVKQSGGYVRIASEPGHGTQVRIYLPRRDGEAAAAGTAQAAPAPGIGPRACVLLVEDDDQVRAYTKEILRELGHEVIEAGDGPAALVLLDREAERIDLLFTDIVMPGMSGRELACRAREKIPGLRLLFTSGFERSDALAASDEATGPMLSKPFTFPQLAEKLAQALAG